MSRSTGPRFLILAAIAGISFSPFALLGNAKAAYVNPGVFKLMVEKCMNHCGEQSFPLENKTGLMTALLKAFAEDAGKGQDQSLRKILDPFS